MSGIILPGKDKQPKPAGGIELAKGFTPRREEKPAEQSDQPAPPPETPSTTPPPAPAPRARGQQAPDLLFPPTGAQVRCPNCGTPYVVPIFTIIDLGVNPELKGPLLSGQVNMAVCPSCGTGGALGAPLMVHEPNHQFLGVFVPPESGRDDLQRQKAIGDLTQALMRKLPTDARKGYMLQPKQYVDWQRFVEKLWEFEGVTAEMLRKNRDQTALLQRLMNLADDNKALDIALERSANLIDREFFTLLDQVMLASRGQPQSKEIEKLGLLRQKLLDTTEAGQAVKRQQEKVRAILQQIKPTATRAEMLSIVVDAWQEEDGRQIVGTLALAAAPLMDYQFLMLLSERIGETRDPQDKKQLEDLRQFVVDLQEQVVAQRRQAQESMAQQAQTILQEVLQSPDPQAALNQYADFIDESFLSLLAANIQAAERNKATAAARRLRQIYELALSIIQQELPEDVQLLNQLINAPDEGTARQLLKENRKMIDRDFLEALKPLESEMRENGRPEIADRIKTLRGQIALMI